MRGRPVVRRGRLKQPTAENADFAGILDDCLIRVLSEI
jgi:hypothetical protein